MRRALLGVLLTALFVLMLSALVVSPEVPEMPVPLFSRDVHAVMVPMPPSSAQADLTAPEHPAELRLLAVCLLPAAALRLLRPAAADSNGRILRAVRYENSFYSLFRPEVACG